MKAAGKMCLVVLCLIAGAEVVSAQNSLRLREAGTNRDEVQLQIGQQVTVEVFADLGSVDASGISVFVAIPRDNFLVVDQRPVNEAAGDTTRQASAGTQPFIAGPLFDGAGESRNLLNSSDDVVGGALDDHHVIEYQVVFGVGANRSRTGTGVVASFQLQAIRPSARSLIRILDNPNQETRVTLADGGERRFKSTPQGMEISVLGLELLDVPDVILLPGEADSVQIGSLSQYVSNVLSPIDSLKWTFSSPVDDDSLEIEIKQPGNIVAVRPLLGWSGRARVLWTATDSLAGVRFPGPAPSSIEFSDIIVNNPPVFVRDRLGRPLERGPDGVKRDTVRFREDEHTFIAEGASLDARRAFRGVDLDDLVDDPDLTNPDEGLLYAVSFIGANATNAQVRGDDDQITHQLLVWALPDFSGVDSLRVLVQDEARGRDTLRVIVEVEGVADAPEFILPESEHNPRISRGSTRNFRFDELVADPDTPLDSLVFRWVDDPEGHFFADTTRAGDGSKLVSVTGDALFVGDGRISFEVADPDSLKDTMIIFFEAAESLPPDVPSEFPIRLTAGGGRDQQNLDDFVEDPDNSDNELGWAVPPLHTSDISVNEARQLSVQSPPDFVGYEAVDLTVSDPDNQQDVLTLRIYSSDGRPVVGGIPDIILDRGDQNKDIDLDDYSHDADNTPQELTWQVLGDFDRDNLQVGVAPLSNLVTFFAPETAVFRTETVIFQVIDPGGRSWQDTVLVTIRSGGIGSAGLFEIKPAIPPLQAEVGLIPTQVLDLDEHLEVSPLISRGSITWSITRQGDIGAILLTGDNKDKVLAFSDSAGVDTVEFVATDSLGRTEKASTTIRYFGQSELLVLRSIPDISFIAGQVFSGLQLNDFIFDGEAHPDSVIEWRAELLGDSEGVFVRVNDDNTIFAISPDTVTIEAVFIATNTVIGVTGRDTVQVIAQDPALATLALKDFTEVVIAAGDVDSTIILNDFLPDGTEANTTIWGVSGQTIVVPFINPEAPHKLSLTALGNRIGEDTLSFSVELGGGFRALGDMVVRVVEPVDATTFAVRIIPNSTNVEFLNLFVMSRAELASIPSVVFSFGASDTTIAVSQIETELKNRGVLLWSGRANIPAGQSGEATVSAQAKTLLGTDVTDSESVFIGTATAGKAIALRQGDIEVTLPAGAVERDTKVLLQRDSEGALLEAEASGETDDELRPELVMRVAVNLFPVQLSLKRAADLKLVSSEYNSTDGLYRQEGGAWIYVAGSSEIMRFERFGRYAIMRDQRAPSIEIVDARSTEVKAILSDGGSGIDSNLVSVRLNGVQEGRVTLYHDVLEWTPTEPLEIGDHQLEITVQDRAGNRSTHALSLEAGGTPLPTTLELGNNYPNPFNPETVIPFTVPDFDVGEAGASGVRIRLAIYNTTGQMVRLLLDDHVMRSGQHEIVWDGRDADGRRAASGVYLYRVEGNRSAVITKRMTLLK